MGSTASEGTADAGPSHDPQLLSRPQRNLLSSTSKALALVETLASAGRPSGVSELARLTGSSRGTVHKQLSTLVACGWVEQHADGRYGLSLRSASIGNAALRQAGLGEKIQLILEEIVDRTGECATIAALDRQSAVIVQRAESHQVLNANIRVGTSIPLVAGASALVLLAFATHADQREEWRRAGVELAADDRIEEVREAGHAWTEDEFLAGVSAASVPLRDSVTGTTTAFTIVGPKGRFDIATALDALLPARERIHSLAALPAPQRPTADTS
jgi:DNA-binding IclR family transcriptional regulator